MLIYFSSAAEAVVKLAFAKNSLDNLTAVVVRFPWNKANVLMGLTSKPQETTLDEEEAEVDMFG